MYHIADKQARKYQLTINNPLPDYSHNKIKEICFTKFKSFRFGVMADEIGKNGTYHIHLFICFDNPLRFSTIKKNFVTAHIEVARGSIEQNIEYITKSSKWASTEKAETSIDGTFEEFGDKPPENKGKNRDMEELYNMIVVEELSNADIIRINNDYIMQIDKLDKIRTMHLQEKFKGTRRLDIKVSYVQGVTGSGKSRNILDTYGDGNTYRVTDMLHPFDQYNCEPVIVFEEFRSSLPLNDMLNYLDIYPIQLQARYANKYACYNRVFLCTNWKLEKQYEEIQRQDPESWKAFLRRIHEVRDYTTNGVITYNSVNEYMNRSRDFISIEKISNEEQLEIPFM